MARRAHRLSLVQYAGNCVHLQLPYGADRVVSVARYQPSPGAPGHEPCARARVAGHCCFLPLPTCRGDPVAAAIPLPAAAVAAARVVLPFRLLRAAWECLLPCVRWRRPADQLPASGVRRPFLPGSCHRALGRAHQRVRCVALGVSSRGAQRAMPQGSGIRACRQPQLL